MDWVTCQRYIARLRQHAREDMRQRLLTHALGQTTCVLGTHNATSCQYCGARV